jgi:hypothetical protein
MTMAHTAGIKFEQTTAGAYLAVAKHLTATLENHFQQVLETDRSALSVFSLRTKEYLQLPEHLQIAVTSRLVNARLMHRQKTGVTQAIGAEMVSLQRTR